MTGDENREGSDQQGAGETPRAEWRRYHCPVCSHWDRVTVTGEQASWIQCSHCDTLLEVLYDQGGAETIPVRVMLNPPKEGGDG